MTAIETREFLDAPMQRTRHGNGSMTFNQRINGRAVRIGYSPQCHVCRCDGDVVRQITVLANTGAAAKLIWEISNEGIEPRFSYQSLLNHLKKHTPDRESVDAAQHAVARAFQEAGDIRKVSAHHAVQLVIEKGFALMAGDHMEIKTSDLLAAAKIMNEFDSQNQGHGDAAFYGEAMSIMLTEMRKILSEEQFQRLLWALDTNERMREIANIVNGHAIEADLIERERDAEDETEFRAYPALEPVEPVERVAPTPDYADVIRDL